MKRFEAMGQGNSMKRWCSTITGLAGALLLLTGCSPREVPEGLRRADWYDARVEEIRQERQAWRDLGRPLIEGYNFAIWVARVDRIPEGGEAVVMDETTVVFEDARCIEAQFDMNTRDELWVDGFGPEYPVRVGETWGFYAVADANGYWRVRDAICLSNDSPDGSQEESATATPQP